MPIEFIQQQQPTGSSGGNLFRLTMAYDGSGRRISKTRWVKSAGSQDWEKELVTHYTGIGTEIRESFTGANAETKVVVNMPNGLGRYEIEDAVEVNANASKNFEWYLKNHLGSTMLVYGTVASTDPTMVDVGTKISAYDYRAFGEMVELTPPPTGKVTENFTGKELDEEITLSYFGARYLDPMLGMWISVDPKREYYNSYLYANNNPMIRIDPDGNQDGIASMIRGQFFREQQINTVAAVKSVPGTMRPFVKNSVMNAANRVGSAFKESVLFVEPAVTAVEFGIPIACAFMGTPVSAGMLIAFGSYNAVDSGLKYGVDGAFSSMVIDATFGLIGSKFAPGAKATEALVGGSFKQSIDNALQNALNYGVHKAFDAIWEFEPSDIPLETITEKSSSTAFMENGN